VSAEAEEVRPAAVHRVEEVEARDRTRASLRIGVAVERDHHGRSVDPLDDAGGDDPDHARVPSLPREDDTPVARRLVIALQQLEGAVQRRPVGLLPEPVLLLESFREPVCLGRIVGEQQPHAARCFSHAPDRVDARREHEAHLSGGDLRPPVEPGGAEQCP
jgi:hypothetical protein